MNDREKVIKGLERCFECLCDECDVDERTGAPWDCPAKDNMIREAIRLLKEQDAVEARKKNDGKPQPWTSWWYVCGDCGQEIEYHDRFCRWCGRVVKWNG